MDMEVYRIGSGIPLGVNQIDPFKPIEKSEIKIGHSVREDRSANYQNCYRSRTSAFRFVRRLHRHERDGYAPEEWIKRSDRFRSNHARRVRTWANRFQQSRKRPEWLRNV